MKKPTKPKRKRSLHYVLGRDPTIRKILDVARSEGFTHDASIDFDDYYLTLSMTEEQELTDEQFAEADKLV